MIHVKAKIFEQSNHYVVGPYTSSNFKLAGHGLLESVVTILKKWNALVRAAAHTKQHEIEYCAW